MLRKLWWTAWWTSTASVAALLASLIQPLQAQGLWQSLYSGSAPAPSRPATGYVRPSGPGYLPSAPPISRFGSYFIPFLSQTRQDDLAVRDHGAYRTLCVRMCDGFYFPISHATTSAGFDRDAERCTASCGSEARLFYHPNSASDAEGMLDLTGRAYASYPTAFRYRKALVPGCQCRPEPWSEKERARHRAYAAAKAAPSPSLASSPEPAVSDDHSPAVVGRKRRQPHCADSSAWHNGAARLSPYCVLRSPAGSMAAPR